MHKSSPAAAQRCIRVILWREQRNTKLAKLIIKTQDDGMSAGVLSRLQQNGIKPKRCRKKRVFGAARREVAEREQEDVKRADNITCIPAPGFEFIWFFSCMVAQQSHKKVVRQALQGSSGWKRRALDIGQCKSARAWYIFAVLLGDFPS